MSEEEQNTEVTSQVKVRTDQGQNQKMLKRSVGYAGRRDTSRNSAINGSKEIKARVSYKIGENHHKPRMMHKIWWVL